jgi:hypothetical protein
VNVDLFILFLPYKKVKRGTLIIVIMKKYKMIYLIVIRNIEGPTPNSYAKSNILNYF